MGGRLRVEVLCEEHQHEGFARGVLKYLGADCTRVDLAPRGKGAAARWVMKRYEQVRLRATAKRHQAWLGLLGVLDGDNEGHDARLRQMHPRGQERDSEGRVALWVPAWSLETWVLWLTGADVDEHASLKQHCDSAEFRALLPNALTGWAGVSSEEPACVPSRATARLESKRVPFA